MDKDNYKNAIFLLGGHDLEMLEIKEMLLSRGIIVHDENLQWDNAQLSKYGNTLNDTGHFVGIELMTDIETPIYYMLIDHHNENAGKASSIEQVAELLDIALNHDQRLVAANDKGYIPAMEAMEATTEEIEDIRKRDRKAQGVTKEDERLGEKSIKENLIMIGDLIQISSLTPHFSTITDRLYPYKELLIDYNNEIVYYGNKSSILVNEFCNLIVDNKAFTGGGKNGYFGINGKKVNKTETKLLYKEILNILLI